MEIIVIDPGHGAPDPGVVGAHHTEADINLRVSWKLAKALEKLGFTVILTRPFETRLDADRSHDMRARVDLANRMNADLFISIHCNGHSTEQPQGYEVFWHKESANGKRLAQLVNREMAKALPMMRNRGAKSDSTLYSNGLYVLRYTRMPAILIELGFLTNPHDARLLANQEVQWMFVDAITRGVTAYFGRPL